MIRALSSQILPQDIKQRLSELGVECISAGKNPLIHNETAYHPDMLFYKLLSGKLLSAVPIDVRINNLDTITAKITPKEGYPNDCQLNCLIAKNCLFCGGSAAEEIVADAEAAGLEIVRVKQGYVACSTVKVNEGAYISSDSGITKALFAKGFDVLQVANDGIELNGYNNGFIGGCSISTEKFVGFTGDIEKHKDYISIKQFIESHGKKVISLCERTLYDYGGFILI